ncbi:lamin tail domain-containing protein 2 isoform X4 [Fukomys damarensis]|uniref:lamin tail domain-containing protein 2 isoform X4 n=1 Tax=Fukomys damarensis TaxID=885580 RepID=UPI0005402A4C|nr:lamin tail domain-containing protein 2 isoform X4 [Fukomys damarensis]
MLPGSLTHKENPMADWALLPLSFPSTSSMAPEPGQESEEEQVPLALAGREPVGNDSGPPATISTDTMASSCSRNTRPPSTGVGSISTKLALEALDPCTLRLLWEQRELEIQALRWAIWQGQDARQQHILQEVAGLPPERSSHSQDTVLQNQVQKLTLELRAKKEQAQLERECLEAQLAQTMDKLQQLEAELQAFQKSCLLHLAQSSWVGRILRSQTGSVEVITAETLMEPGDFSEDEQKPTTGEMEVLAKSFSGDSEGLPSPDLRKCSSHQFGQISMELGAAEHAPSRACGSGSLRIVAVSRREKFVRILNCSSQDTADLGGLVLQQWVCDCPVRMFRFPRGTVLEPRHHLTVWGEGTGGVQQQLPLCSSQDPLQFHIGWGCVTLLLDTEGQVLSEYQEPLRVTSGSRIFTDNTDWSIDCFPLPEAGARPNLGELQRRPRPPRQGRVQEARAGRRRQGTQRLMPLLSPRKPAHLREVPEQPEGAKLVMPEPLPTIPEAARKLEPCMGGKKHSKERSVCVSAHPDSNPNLPYLPKVQPAPVLRPQPPKVCRRGVDLGCPMVALSVQSTAESRFGFRFLCCPPITADLSLWRV